MTPPARALSATAFATLLLIALMMGANHVAARIAFNHGADVATAVVFRSAVTALVIVAILAAQGVRVAFTARHKRMLPLIGLLIGVQSLCLYSAVARLPVALALLAFNTYPIWTALWSWVVYRQRPERAMLIAMPVILAGLALALDVLGAASGLGAAGQWGRIGAAVSVHHHGHPLRQRAHQLVAHGAGGLRHLVDGPSTAPLLARPHSVTSLPKPTGTPAAHGVRSTVIMSMLTRPTRRVRTPFTSTGVPVSQWRG
jgi:uncharacterized membrane protein